MNQTLRNALRLTGVILACLVLFLGSAWGYLSYRSGADTRAGTSAESIPYAAPLPDSAGLLVALPEGNSILFYLDFSDHRAVVVFAEGDGEGTAESFGYTVDYTLVAGYDLIAGMIDRIGGIELDLGEGLYRYTGVQVVELISERSDPTVYRRLIVTALMSRISETGMTRQDFVYLIENGETDLTVPDCFEWPEQMALICRSVQMIGE